MPGSRHASTPMAAARLILTRNTSLRRNLFKTIHDDLGWRIEANGMGSLGFQKSGLSVAVYP